MALNETTEDIMADRLRKSLKKHARLEKDYLEVTKTANEIHDRMCNVELEIKALREDLAASDRYDRDGAQVE